MKSRTTRIFTLKVNTPERLSLPFSVAHWITLMPSIVVHIFFVVVFFVVIATFSTPILAFIATPLGEIVFVLSIFLITYAVHSFYLKLINHFLNSVIITNFRIVENQKIIFIKDLQVSVDMRMIQDVKKEQNGILENLLNFGELIIMLSSSSDIRVIKFVPNPNFHFRLINRIKLENLHKQAEEKVQSRNHQSILYENFSSYRTREKHAEHEA